MLEKYGKIKATLDILIVLGLLYIAATKGGLLIIAALALYGAWIGYKLYSASAAVEEDRVAAAVARMEEARNAPYAGRGYTGGGYSSGYTTQQTATQPTPTQPTTTINNTSSTTGDIALGMMIGSMLSNHGTQASSSTTVHHVYDRAPTSDEPAALAPITSEQLDSGSYSKSTERYGEALAPITSEELDKSSSSSSSSSDSSWGSSSSSSSSSSSDWGSSSSSSYDSGSSSSYDSGSSSSSSSSDW
jgi:hypothetical protein